MLTRSIFNIPCTRRYCTAAAPVYSLIKLVDVLATHPPLNPACGVKVDERWQIPAGARSGSRLPNSTRSLLIYLALCDTLDAAPLGILCTCRPYPPKSASRSSVTRRRVRLIPPVRIHPPLARGVYTHHYVLYLDWHLHRNPSFNAQRSSHHEANQAFAFPPSYSRLWSCASAA
jgi:hypothetical protein